MGDDESQLSFWSTIAQVTPVLGLAFVIEARALAKRWTLERKHVRRTEAVAILVIGIALSSVFATAIDSLMTGLPAPMWQLVATRIAVTGIFWVLAVNALVIIFARGTSDLNPIVDRILPFSPTRRLIRAAKRARRQVPKLLAQVESTMEKAEVVVSRSRAGVTRKRRLSEFELTELTGLIAASDLQLGSEELRESTKIDRLRAALDDYRKDPRVCRAMRVREENLRFAIHLYAATRLYRLRLVESDREAEEMLSDLRSRELSERDRVVIEQMISVASEPALLPWSTGIHETR